MGTYLHLKEEFIFGVKLIPATSTGHFRFNFVIHFHLAHIAVKASKERGCARTGGRPTEAPPSDPPLPSPPTRREGGHSTSARRLLFVVRVPWQSEKLPTSFVGIETKNIFHWNHFVSKLPYTAHTQLRKPIYWIKLK